MTTLNSTEQKIARFQPVMTDRKMAIFCRVEFLARSNFSYKLVKMLCVWICVWMLTRVEQIVTAAHRDL